VRPRASWLRSHSGTRAANGDCQTEYHLATAGAQEPSGVPKREQERSPPCADRTVLAWSSGSARDRVGGVWVPDRRSAGSGHRHGGWAWRARARLARHRGAVALVRRRDCRSTSRPRRCAAIRSSISCEAQELEDRSAGDSRVDGALRARSARMPDGRPDSSPRRPGRHALWQQRLKAQKPSRGGAEVRAVPDRARTYGVPAGRSSNASRASRDPRGPRRGSLDLRRGLRNGLAVADGASLLFELRATYM
jgi:hypothetical protein